MLTLQAIQGDITKISVDAIVNAANSSLLGGGGVDGAIHRAGGPKILEECQMIRARQGGCKTSEAVITTAGNLPAKYVIHTVGPIWNGSDSQRDELASAYRNSIKLAMENGCTSVSFPNISTGAYGFPKDLAAQIAVKTARESAKTPITKIIFVCFDKENLALYEEALKK